MTNLAVIRNHGNHRHVPGRNLVVPCTRSLQRCFVCTSESSIQRFEQTVFIVSLQLPSSTIWHPFTTGNPIESSISCSIWTKVQWGMWFTAAPVSRFIFHPSQPLRRLLVAPRSKPPSENELAEVSYVCSHTFVPSNRTPVIIPLIKTPAIVPFVKSSSHHESMKCQWDMFCADSWVSELISDFEFSRPERPVFDVFPCANLWHLWFLWFFLWIFQCSRYSLLCPHSWTVTCSVCLWQTIACLCSCVHCSLVEHVFHRTLKHPSHGLDDPFPLPDETMGSECPTRTHVTRLGITNS